MSFLDFWKGYYRGWGCKKVQDYTENVRKNKPKTTKPQSEKSKLTPSNIVKPKQKRQKDWRKRQALVYNPLHNLAHATFMSEDSELTDTDDETTSGTEKCCVCTVHTRSNSLFAEYGVIVRNLNYLPWQWVYSISGCKSFPGCF